MFLVVRPADTLFLPPSIVPKWRGLRGLVVHARGQQDRLATVVEHTHVPLLHSDLRPQIANVNSIERGAKNSLVSKAFS